MQYFDILKSKVSTKLILIAAIVIAIILTVLYDSFQKEKAIPTNQPETMSQPSSTSNKSTQKTQNTRYDKPETPINFQYCENLIKEIPDEGRSWVREHYESWDTYLDQGYTLNDITAAIEDVGSRGFASSFRIKQLRLSSESTKALDEQKRAIEALIPDLFKESGISIGKNVPQPALKNYSALTPKQKQGVLEKEQVNVDDLAYFITDSSLNEGEVIELLAHIENPTSKVIYEDVRTTSLVEYAVTYQRSEVLKELIKRGVTPMDDEYLGNAMEIALSTLSHNWGNRKIISIIKTLNQISTPAIFTHQDSDKVSGRSNRYFYEFNQTQITQLIQDHNLDLTQILPRNPIEASSNGLSQLIKEQRDTHLSQTLNIPEPQKLKSTCQAHIDAINQHWQPVPASVKIKEIIEQQGNVSALVKAELSILDPLLIDVYRIHSDDYKRSKDPVASAYSVWQMIEKEGIQQVIQHFSDKRLNEAQKYALFVHIIQLTPNFYDDLINSELNIPFLEYYEFDWLRLLDIITLTNLTSAGADLKSEDIRGKTLLYYAVNKANINVIEYMEEENYPFKKSATGEDPLHIALDTSRTTFSAGKALRIIEILMRYNPKIDNFHLNKMALLKLRYTTLYDKIITAFPDLSTGDSTELPAFIQDHQSFGLRNESLNLLINSH